MAKHKLSENVYHEKTRFFSSVDHDFVNKYFSISIYNSFFLHLEFYGLNGQIRFINYYFLL
jgi:hypothetical protein